MTHTDLGLLRYTIDQLISWRKHAKPLDYEVRSCTSGVLSSRLSRTAGKRKYPEQCRFWTHPCHRRHRTTRSGVAAAAVTMTHS